MRKITVWQVNKRVEAIRKDDDDEGQHSAEDALHCDVLAAIADGAPNPQELAKAALATSEIRFARWCA